MKIRICSAIVAAVMLAGAPLLLAQSKAKATNVPEIAYESVPNFFKMPPNIYFGEGIGVATNSKGHVWVYTRSGETRLFEFDQNGAFVREIGQGLYGLVFAHAVRVDKDDNVWVVDEGSNMVIKFNPAGRVVMTIGRRPEAVEELTSFSGQGAYTGANKPYSFNRPTDVAWDAQGNIYIGDRSNARVQVWDNDLNPKAIYDTVGSPWAVCVSPGPHQYLFVSNSVPDNGDSRAAAQTGEIYKMELDGTILGKFGKAGKALKEFSTVHEIDCRNPNELFVSEITDWRVQKIILKPQPTKTSAGAAK